MLMTAIQQINRLYSCLQELALIYQQGVRRSCFYALDITSLLCLSVEVCAGELIQVCVYIHLASTSHMAATVNNVNVQVCC